MTAARDNIIFVVVNLDPHRKQNSFVDVPIEQFGYIGGDEYRVQDLLSGATYTWRGRRNYVELAPNIQPAPIFLVHRRVTQAILPARAAMRKGRAPSAG